MYLYALACCLYIFTIGYAFKKNRKLISNMCEIFGFQKLREMADPEIRTTIPEITLPEIADDAALIRLRNVSWDDGNITLLELTAAVKLIKRYNPRKIFEIGTFNGRTALNMACNTAEGAIVYTLDLPEKNGRAGARFHGADCENKIIQLFGDSAAFDFSPYENSVDLVFVDGAHTYDYALSDTEKALKLLKNGRGIILWHDYSWVWPDVTRALNRLYSSDVRFKNVRHIKDTSLVCLIKD